MENTIDAVRLALRMHELQAQTASLNIANGSQPQARVLRTDFADAQAALLEAARAQGSEPLMRQRLQEATAAMSSAEPLQSDELINLDAQVSDMVAASADYQALSEALSRHLGLMRLAISGRS